MTKQLKSLQLPTGMKLQGRGHGNVLRAAGEERCGNVCEGAPIAAVSGSSFKTKAEKVPQALSVYPEEYMRDPKQPALF